MSYLRTVWNFNRINKKAFLGLFYYQFFELVISISKNHFRSNYFTGISAENSSTFQPNYSCWLFFYWVDTDIHSRSIQWFVFCDTQLFFFLGIPIIFLKRQIYKTLDVYYLWIAWCHIYHIAIFQYALNGIQYSPDKNHLLHFII